MEDAIGSRLPGRATDLPLVPAGWRTWLYRLAIERGYLDVFLADYIARPILRALRACDALERRWTDLLTAGPSRESDEVAPSDGSLQEPR